MKFTNQILVSCLLASSCCSSSIVAGQNLRTNTIIQNNDNDDLIAVIHIGPMKTGSSAIQASLGIVVPEIETIDNYVDAGFALDKGIEAYHMIGCFRPDAVQYTGGDYFEISCHPNALQQIQAVATNKHNLIITAEYLTDPQTDLLQLKEFLSPWKQHKIIAYYRRYYDWVISFHNQIYKQESPKNRKSISDFIIHESQYNFLWETSYLVDAVQRYSQHFTNIQIINMYDLPNHDARVAFYCNGLINATSSCSKFKEYIKTEIKHIENPSVPLIYSDLVHYAKEMGLWSEATTGLTDANVELMVQNYQENILQLQSHEFTNAVVCPTKDAYEILLRKSLLVEEQLFPHYFYNTGKDEIKNHFQSIMTTKMCHVDATIVLQSQPIWIQFFQNLVGGTSTSNNNNNATTTPIVLMQ